MQDKWCIIVNAVSRRGVEIAMQFAAKRCNIAFLDMDKESGKRLKKFLEQEYRVKVFFFHGDIRSDEDRDIFTSVINERYGGADYFMYGKGAWHMMAYPVRGEWKFVF